MVEVTGLEPAASSSQNWRATSCATPRNIKFFIGFQQKNRKCGILCGRGVIISYFLNKVKRKNVSIKGFFEVSANLLELPFSRSQNWRATNCATPRNRILNCKR